MSMSPPLCWLQGVRAVRRRPAPQGKSGLQHPGKQSWLLSQLFVPCYAALLHGGAFLGCMAGVLLVCTCWPGSLWDVCSTASPAPKAVSTASLTPSTACPVAALKAQPPGRTLLLLLLCRRRRMRSPRCSTPPLRWAGLHDLTMLERMVGLSQWA